MATDDFLPFLTEAAENLDIKFLGNPQAFDNLPESDTGITAKRRERSCLFAVYFREYPGSARGYDNPGRSPAQSGTYYSAWC